MKKVILATLILGGLTTMTSCKKDWTCSCTVGGQTSSTTIPDASKKDAQEACDALDVAATIGGGSCTLE